MDRAPYAKAGPAFVLRRASTSALTGSLLVLLYVRAGSDLDVRSAMTVVVAVMLATAVAGVTVATLLPHRCRTTWPASAVSWTTLIGSAVLAHLDGGVATPLGFVMLSTLPLVGIVMSKDRLVRFGLLTAALYVAVLVLGEPAPAGYVFVHTLAFLMLTVVSAHHAESRRALRRRLARVAAVDPLTGCLNRGAFDRQLTAELVRAERQDEQLSIVLLDLDGFKAVNDAHGHSAGDDLLAWTGRTLRASVRSHDVVGRIGGDEFAVLLTHDARDLPATVERLREAVGRRVPTSAGHATWPVDAPDEDGLRHRADERLYADKAARTGRGHGTDAWDHAAGDEHVDAVDEERSTATGGREPRLARWARTSLAGLAEDRWRLTLVQIGSLGSLSCLVALVYAVVFADHGGDPWMVGPCLVGMLVGGLVVLLAPRVARVRGRRVVVTLLNAMNIGLVMVVAGRDGGVGSPLIVGILNSIPLVALSAPPRLAAPHVGVLLTAYGVLAVGAGVDDPWIVVAHLGVYVSLAWAYASHADYARRQWRVLRRASRSDGLTGCLNRRGFEERLAAALARSARTGVPVSLLVLDLDGFKAVNDTHGHAAGDELLRWVADRVRDTCRVFDSVCRLGGDEFAVVLPDTDAAGAARIAARLRAVLGERVSTSVGTATGAGVTGGEQADGDPAHPLARSLYVQADRALYAEKTRRRGTDRRAECASV